MKARNQNPFAVFNNNNASDDEESNNDQFVVPKRSRNRRREKANRIALDAGLQGLAMCDKTSKKKKKVKPVKCVMNKDPIPAAIPNLPTRPKKEAKESVPAVLEKQQEQPEKPEPIEDNNMAEKLEFLDRNNSALLQQNSRYLMETKYLHERVESQASHIETLSRVIRDLQGQNQIQRQEIANLRMEARLTTGFGGTSGLASTNLRSNVIRPPPPGLSAFNRFE